MKTDPKPTRGMPRSLLYAMIPGGFLLFILILFLMGFWTQEVTDDPTDRIQEPAGASQPAATPEVTGPAEPAGVQD